MLSNFTYRETDEHSLFKNFTDTPSSVGKIILNPRRSFNFLNTHFPLLFLNFFYVVDENSNIAKDWTNQLVPQKICIHHYFTKSKEEYIERRSLGRVDAIDKYRPIEEFYSHDFNDVYDDSMLYYVEKMKNLKLF